jgi:hypothetical protein
LISARVAAVGVCAIAVPATKAAAIAPTTKNLVFIVLLQDMPNHESEEPCKRREWQRCWQASFASDSLLAGLSMVPTPQICLRVDNSLSD